MTQVIDKNVKQTGRVLQSHPGCSSFKTLVCHFPLKWRAQNQKQYYRCGNPCTTEHGCHLPHFSPVLLTIGHEQSISLLQHGSYCHQWKHLNGSLSCWFWVTSVCLAGFLLDPSVGHLIPVQFCLIMLLLLLQYVEIYWDPGTMDQTHSLTFVWLFSTILSLVLSLYINSSSINPFWVSTVSVRLWIHCDLFNTDGLRLTQRSTCQALTPTTQALVHATEGPAAKGSEKSPGHMDRSLGSSPVSTLIRLCEQHMVQQTEDTLGIRLPLSSCGKGYSLLPCIILFFNKNRPPF